MAETLAIILVAAAVLWAAASVVRAGRAQRRERRDLLADCVGLLDGGRLEQDPAGYGVLRGRYRGQDVAIRPFSEMLGFRRLPQLWLAVTVRVPTGIASEIDVLRRSNGSEFYSSADRLPARLRPPPSWPSETRVQGSAGAAAELASFEASLGPLLHDDRTKNVTLTPSGVRLVTQHRQGARGAYLIYREERFEDARVTVEEARRLLDAASAVVERRVTSTRADFSDERVEAA